jgi:hypothetical protein
MSPIIVGTQSPDATTTFGTVKQELYDSGFDYLVDNGQTARAGRWVNQAYLELCGLEKWPFREVATTGTSPVQLQTLGDIIYVRDTVSKNKLVESEFDTLTDIQPDLTTTGTPQWYYQDSTSGTRTVTVFPVSTNSLQIVYHQIPAALSSDGDILIVPDRFIDIVVLGAMRRAYLDGTDTAQQYNLVKTEWNDRVQEMRSQLLPRPQYQAISSWPYGSEDW